MSKIKKLIRNSWVITIVGGLIVAIILTILQLLIKLPYKLMKLIYKFLIITWNLPVYVIILIFLGGIFLPILGLLLHKYLKPKQPWGRYIKDKFYDINWQWKWGKNEVIDLIPLCPQCYCELTEEKVYHPVHGKCFTGYLRCYHCHFRINMNQDETRYLANLIEKAKKEIERKIRTGEYLP